MKISKSQYIRGLQCHKSLWLLKHRPELRDEADEVQESRFNEGTQVGELAQKLFPGRELIDFDPSDFKGMIERTATLIKQGVKTIYEAAFSEQGIFVMVDILQKVDRHWEFFEVKSATAVKGYYLDDAAIQWYVLKQAGLKLTKGSIIHINNQYVHKKRLGLKSLFNILDVSKEIKERQTEIEPTLANLGKMLKRKEPKIDIGPHCSAPFECDFSSHCWGHVPSPSVFDLYRLNGERKFELYDQGLITYKDLQKGTVLNEKQQMQVDAGLSGKAHIDTDSIRAFLAGIKYPISFFDFETFSEAIPRFEGQRPYQQIPFQYSLHIQKKNGELTHKEFLGDENCDPRRALAERMLKDIPKQGTIIAYNMSFEKTQIKELAEEFKDLGKDLLALNERFVDLIVPFRSGAYYHPDFGGSFSIKSVLPALFPNDPELDYKKLEIQNGGMAMETFAKLHLLKDQTERDSIRQGLLAYCRLDTLAMVRIVESLFEMI